jgi:hypothetical protein
MPQPEIVAYTAPQRLPFGLPCAVPVVYCRLCNKVSAVDPFARGFPPDAAKRKLREACRQRGCVCDPQYVAGVAP